MTSVNSVALQRLVDLQVSRCERSHKGRAVVVRVAAVGDNVVDCYPARREMYPGGSCLNLSIFARRFGEGRIATGGELRPPMSGRSRTTLRAALSSRR